MIVCDIVKIINGMNRNKKYTIWFDGGNWNISVKGKEQEQCKTVKEWLMGDTK